VQEVDREKKKGKSYSAQDQSMYRAKLPIYLGHIMVPALFRAPMSIPIIRQLVR
jgi:hypothetical protein